MLGIQKVIDSNSGKKVSHDSNGVTTLPSNTTSYDEKIMIISKFKIRFAMNHK